MSFCCCSISFLSPPLQIPLHPFTFSQVTKALYIFGVHLYFILCYPLWLGIMVLFKVTIIFILPKSMVNFFALSWILLGYLQSQLFPLLKNVLISGSVTVSLLFSIPYYHISLPILECPWLCPWLSHHLFLHSILNVILIPSWLEKPLWHS